MNILPEPQDRGIVVFRFAPGLPYGRRMGLALGAIVVGLVIQALTGSFLAGVAFLVAGNLLLLVRGYDNRVDFASFDPDAHWERVERERLGELRQLDRRMRKWDQSALDVTNPLGAVAWLALAAGLAAGAWFGRGPWRILALDAAVLLLPHWVTGVRRILVRPKLLVRVETIESVLRAAAPRLAAHEVQLLMLLEGGQVAIPEDVKFKVELAGRHEDFLGLYGQVVINEVQGTSHPYFYVVLVARRSFGLEAACADYRPPEGLVKELKLQDEVEVLVVRQETTKTGGYATKAAAAARILDEGLDLAERIAGSPRRAA